MGEVAQVSILYDRLPPLEDLPARILPDAPLLDLGKNCRLKPLHLEEDEPRTRKRKAPEPGFESGVDDLDDAVKNQQDTREEAGYDPDAENLFAGDVLDSAPAPVSRTNLKPAAAAPAVPLAPGRDEDLPWFQASKRITSPLLRLHNEIVEFTRFLAPTPAEKESRRVAVARVTAVVKAIWPNAEVHVFGSYVTGLYLPTSDMDLVISNSGCHDVVMGLKAIATSLTRRKLATDIQVIAKAKVPIIKFVDAQSGLSFDISFDVANGPQAAEFVLNLMSSLPPMKPLVLILKMFLQQRELNEVYSGGIGSYALLVMVASFLLTHHSRATQNVGKHTRPGVLEASLGVLLVDFFRFYGRTLNTTEVGVSCRNGGAFFNKEENGFTQYDRAYFLSVEDPTDPENDLAKGTRHIQKVRAAFDFAYSHLSAPSDPGESLLRRIIRLDGVLLSRERPPDPTPPPWPARKDDYAGPSRADRADGPRHTPPKKDAKREREANPAADTLSKRVRGEPLSAERGEGGRSRSGERDRGGEQRAAHAPHAAQAARVDLFGGVRKEDDERGRHHSGRGGPEQSPTVRPMPMGSSREPGSAERRRPKKSGRDRLERWKRNSGERREREGHGHGHGHGRKDKNRGRRREKDAAFD